MFVLVSFDIPVGWQLYCVAKIDASRNEANRGSTSSKSLGPSVEVLHPQDGLDTTFFWLSRLGQAVAWHCWISIVCRYFYSSSQRTIFRLQMRLDCTGNPTLNSPFSSELYWNYRIFLTVNSIIVIQNGIYK